jgi:maleylpyruvate isomerase
MPTLEEEEAFSHLRARQGAGARYDAEGAPSHDLAMARRGTAYFARLLNNLRDAELYQPSAVPGWSRAHFVAAVAYHAKDLTRIVEAVRSDVARVSLPSKTDREEEIVFAGTLPARALRNLFKHSEVHLNVEWRDLTPANWGASVWTDQTTSIHVKTTPLSRAALIWSHALDLNAGGQASDLPAELKILRP